MRNASQIDEIIKRTQAQIGVLESEKEASVKEVEDLKEEISMLKKKIKREEQTEKNNFELFKKIDEQIESYDFQLRLLKVKIDSNFKIVSPFWSFESSEEYKALLMEDAKLSLERIRENIKSLHDKKVEIAEQNKQIVKERQEVSELLKTKEKELFGLE